MNLNKSREFFDPETLKGKRCHIIGCGALGSCTAELLARAGITNITLWDDDIVEAHNLANQLYTEDQIGMLKTEALTKILEDINPVGFNFKNLMHKGKYTNENLSGFVFLCVDNIEVRKQIVETNRYNTNIQFLIDMRMRLKDGQCYAAEWSSILAVNNLLETMNFTHEEALQNTPISACGFTLSVAPTVRIITSLGVANFMEYIRSGKYKKLILADAFEGFVESYNA